MRVAFVNSTRIWGGVKTWTLRMGRALCARGHEVLVVARPDVFVEECRRAGVAAVGTRFGADFSPLMMLRLFLLLRRHRIDRVVVNVDKEIAAAFLPARLLGIPILNRIGLIEDVVGAKRKVHVLRRLCVDAYLVPSRHMKVELARQLSWLDPDRVHVLLNAVPVDRLESPGPDQRANARRALGVDDGEMVIATVGRLVEEKNHLLLLRAAASLRAQGRTGLRLLVVGDGPMRQTVLELAGELGLGESLLMPGFTTDVPRFLSAADLCVFPSSREGMANVLLEAMAMGLPVIAADLPASAEVIEDGVDGVLARLDPEALAQAIAGLVDDGQLRAGLGHRARQKMIAHFDLASRADELVAVLEALSSRPRRSDGV